MHLVACHMFRDRMCVWATFAVTIWLLITQMILSKPSPFTHPPPSPIPEFYRISREALPVKFGSGRGLGQSFDLNALIGYFSNGTIIPTSLPLFLNTLFPRAIKCDFTLSLSLSQPLHIILTWKPAQVESMIFITQNSFGDRNPCDSVYPFLRSLAHCNTRDSLSIHTFWVFPDNKSRARITHLSRKQSN